MGFFKKRLGLEPEDISGFAEARGLQFRGSKGWPLVGTRVAATSDPRFNVMYGQLPGDERGLLAHVLQTRTTELGTGSSHQPTTIAAFPLAEAVGTLMRVMALPGAKAQGHAYMRPAGSAAAALPRHGTTVAPDTDEEVLAAAIGDAGAALGGIQLHFGMACLWLVRRGYAVDDDLDAFARLGAGIVRRAREASLAKLPPGDPDAELPPPSWYGKRFGSATEQFQAVFAHGLDAPLLEPLAGWVPAVAEHRGWVAEDPLAFHRAFAAAPLRGQVLAVFRGKLAGTPGRLLVTCDVRPPEPGGMNVAVLAAPDDEPTRPGELQRQDDGVSSAGFGGGVLTYSRARESGAVDGGALERLGADAAYFAASRRW